MPNINPIADAAESAVIMVVLFKIKGRFYAPRFGLIFLEILPNYHGNTEVNEK
jgi:hypothetical protein